MKWIELIKDWIV